MYVIFKRLIFCALGIHICLLAACGTNNSNGNGGPPPPPPPPPPKQLSVWSHTFNGIPLTMVGSDPTQMAAGTTKIAVEIIPVAFSFSLANTIISANSIACNDNTPLITRVMNSPLFTNNNWTTSNGISVGNTQYADAFQRANLWTYVNGSSPNYHVLLTPVSVSPLVTVEVPTTSFLVGNPNPFCPSPIGAVPIDFMNSVVQNTIATGQITADTLPIFLTYNVSFLLPGGGQFLGYHNRQGNQTYVVASYNDPGFNLYAYNAADVAVLSHELGEWLDNPLLVNTVPAWGQAGIVPNCSTQLEVGDPLTGNSFQFATSNFIYHIQELAYMSWFTRDVPSLALNGIYSSEGTFTTPAPACF